MYEMFEHLTITQLGDVFGVTRNVMGQYLVEIGLRVREDRGLYPSTKAIERGYCKATEDQHGISFVVWHRLKTIKALEAAGYEQIRSKPAPTKLDGPFSVEANGESGFTINCGDGATAIWVFGQDNARTVAAALNKEFGFSAGA